MAYVGKVAIVTGGASGIGLGIVRHLVKQGARVVIADRPSGDGESVAASLNAQGASKPIASFYPTDVSSWTSQTALFAHSYQAFGPRIDFVFANAGIAQMREMRTSDPSQFACMAVPDLGSLSNHPPDLKVVEVDLNGVLYSLSCSLAYFRAQERDADGWRGKFVATGSNASIYPFPNDTLYAAAKTGVLGAVRSVAPRVFKEGITVNCFGPSVVETGLATSAFFRHMEAQGLLTPMSTVTDGCDLFLAPKSKLTGQIVENCLKRNVFRIRPSFIDQYARQAMDEFWPISEIEEALALPSGVETD